MPWFLYIFGYETPRQRQNNAAHGWDDENSHAVLIDALDANAALAWGDRIAQRYVALLHDAPEMEWAVEGYASFIENYQGKCPDTDYPRVGLGEYPDFRAWLEHDRA